MRKTLAQLQGQLVAFSGWETGSRHNQTWTCVSRPYVIVWNRNDSVQQAVKKKGGFRYDHLWLSGDSERNQPQELKMFNKIGGIGVVRKYERGNGTSDYTVKTPSHRFLIEEFFELYNNDFENRSQKKRLKYLQEALNIIDNHEKGSCEIIFGMATSISSFKEQVQSQELEIKRSIYATELALKSATMNGKCQSLDALKILGHKALPAKGF